MASSFWFLESDVLRETDDENWAENEVDKNMKEDILEYSERRKYLRSDEWNLINQNTQNLHLSPDFSDHSIKRPSVQKSCSKGKLYTLPSIESIHCHISLKDVIRQRKTHRSFSSSPMSLSELSFLLWSCQGIREVSDTAPIRYYRNVPSAGNRHSLETYCLVNNVDGLPRGVYRYLPLDHRLLLLKIDEDIPEKAHSACFSQSVSENDHTDSHYTRDCGVLLVWTAIPYRTEWRYSILAHKMIAIDCGHVCQNLYLASTSLGCGTCAIGAIDRPQMDTLLEVDSIEEFSVYGAAVGKIVP